MSEPASVPALLMQDIVVMQLVDTILANDFQILDQVGNPIGSLHGTDSTLSRLFKGPREFALRDSTGTVLLTITDVLNIGFDTFQLHSPTGQLLADIRKRWSLFGTSVTISTADGGAYEIRGNVMDLDYQIYSGGRPIAQIARHWTSLGKALRGHNRYTVAFTPGTHPRERLLVLGAISALDLIRVKRLNK